MATVILSQISTAEFEVLVQEAVQNALRQYLPKETPEEDILSIKEASKFLKLAIPTIYGKTSRQEIPFMKQGKKLYFSRQDLIDYLKSGRCQSKYEIENEASQNLKIRRAI
jgi:excisionase family DNA binding protein